MAGVITFKVEGLALIQKKLEALDTAIRIRIARDITLPAAAEVLQESMSQRAPRGDTLRLSRGIQVASAGGPSDTLTITLEKDVFYGRFVEFGTKKMPARPFMRPAIDEDGDKALGRAAQATFDEIQRITQGR